MKALLWARNNYSKERLRSMIRELGFNCTQHSGTEVFREFKLWNPDRTQLVIIDTDDLPLSWRYFTQMKIWQASRHGVAILFVGSHAKPSPCPAFYLQKPFTQTTFNQAVYQTLKRRNEDQPLLQLGGTSHAHVGRIRFNDLTSLLETVRELNGRILGISIARSLSEKEAVTLDRFQKLNLFWEIPLIAESDALLIPAPLRSKIHLYQNLKDPFPDSWLRSRVERHRISRVFTQLIKSSRETSLFAAEKITKESPLSLELRFALGQELLRRGQTKAAFGHLRQVQKYNPFFPGIYFALIKCSRLERETREWIATGLKFCPGHPELRALSKPLHVLDGLLPVVVGSRQPAGSLAHGF